MARPAPVATAAAPHIPVLIKPILAAVKPVSGVWLDGTFGAGGYTRALLDAGADRVIAVDRDPSVFNQAEGWMADYGDRLTPVESAFDRLDDIANEHAIAALDGIVLDIGVSSMQIDQAARGFSFAKDGPLDMRMAATGVTAADIVNQAEPDDLADILFQYGEERASRRIARAIAKSRALAPITTTLGLAELIEKCLPRRKPGQVHPATRSFQALRIAVNDELRQLARALIAAERALRAGGILAVVSFHSLEDRIVKRFMQHRSGRAGTANRFAPMETPQAPRFDLVTRKAVEADATEVAANPRARSARLRIVRRTDAPAGPIDFAILGVPALAMGGG